MYNSSSILIALAAGLFVIGVHQSFYYGIQGSYWLFMLSGIIYLYNEYRKKAALKNPDGKNTSKADTAGKKRPKK